jgi:tetratricopeptide (TPR) repeat protein
MEDTMADEHVAEELLRRFLHAEVSPEETRRVVRHLISRCTECVELAHRLAVELQLWPGSGAIPWDELYEEVFDRALAFATTEERRIALEKLRGWAQWAFLEPLPPHERLALVESEPGYHTFGLYDRLLEASRRAIRIEPAEAVDIVRLAIAVADRLDPERIGQHRVADLRAAAQAELGNAKRLSADFPGARPAFDEARRILEQEGSNDPLERSRLLSLEASYLNDLGEFEIAETMLKGALDLCEQIDDTHLQGRILFQMGDTIGHIDPERGLTHIRKALPLLDAKREPRIELCAWHDYAWYLNDSGRPDEALAALEQARPLYAQFPDSYTQLRLHWLEGRIALNLGDHAEAESVFQQLWEEFRARDLHHELVLLSIDLAEALVKNGETNRAAELVEECYPILESWGLHRYALAAWMFFQQALAEHQVEDVFRKVRAYYRRHWARPAELG